MWREMSSSSTDATDGASPVASPRPNYAAQAGEAKIRPSGEGRHQIRSPWCADRPGGRLPEAAARSSVRIRPIGARHDQMGGVAKREWRYGQLPNRRGRMRPRPSRSPRPPSSRAQRQAIPTAAVKRGDYSKPNKCEVSVYMTVAHRNGT